MSPPQPPFSGTAAPSAIFEALPAVARRKAVRALDFLFPSGSDHHCRAGIWRACVFLDAPSRGVPSVAPFSDRLDLSRHANPTENCDTSESLSRKSSKTDAALQKLNPQGFLPPFHPLHGQPPIHRVTEIRRPLPCEALWIDPRLIDLKILKSFKSFKSLIYKVFRMWNGPPRSNHLAQEDRMQSAANKPPVSPASRIPQSLLERFESEWRAMRSAGEAAEKPVTPAE